MKKKVTLPSHWRLKPARISDVPSDVPFPAEGIAARVPGTVHTDLLAAGLIEDPFYGDNERRLQWIHEMDWIYTCRFSWPKDLRPDRPVWLVCEGLDTVVSLDFNGNPLGRWENMFLPAEFVLPPMAPGGEATLTLHFTSPTQEARRREQRLGKLPAALNTSRVYLRKAQYAFGWDWGPVFPTMGIWRPIYLLQPHSAVLRHVLFFTRALKDSAATIQVKVYWQQLEPGTGPLHLEAVLETDTGEVVLQLAGEARENPAVLTGVLERPKPWFCHGLGEPYCYRLRVTLTAGQDVLDTWQGEVGIRTVVLQRQEHGGACFRFRLNGEALFAQGANWIPLDLFLPRVSPDRYREHLMLARQAGMNMIRVWGGGIYEQPEFYHLCNRLGLMVWQDFMFACGAYPDEPEFEALVRREVQQVVRSLQHHPCLALWCGNNENEWNWYMEQSRPVAEMPGYRLFHSVIPEILAAEGIDQPYWPSSPFGREEDPNDPASGNRHQWDVWSRWRDYPEVRRDRSLFVTEFGFQAPANAWTLEAAIPADQRHPQSPIMEFHNKQEEGPARLFRFLASHLPVHTHWAGFLYLTQLNQALALKQCFLHWRSRWSHCSGALVWQLNDCWPVSSWSLVDSQDSPKAAYYAVKQALRPQAVNAWLEQEMLTLTAFSTGNAPFSGRLVVALWDTFLSKPVREHRFPVHLDAATPNQAFSLPAGGVVPNRSLWMITLQDRAGKVCFEDVVTAVPLKHVQLQPFQVKVEVVSQTARSVHLRLSADVLLLAVLVTHPELIPQENLLVLVPGRPRTIGCSKRNARGIPVEEISVTALNAWQLPHHV